MSTIPAAQPVCGHCGKPIAAAARAVGNALFHPSCAGSGDAATAFWRARAEEAGITLKRTRSAARRLLDALERLDRGAAHDDLPALRADLSALARR